MFNFLNKMKKRQLTECLIRSFPHCLRNDVEIVCNYLQLQKDNMSEKYYSNDSTEWLLSSGEIVTLPYRIYLEERCGKTLTQTQKMIYHCIMSRNSDGYVREKHIKTLLESDIPECAIPYIIKICDEYVIEILQTVYDALSKTDCAKYRQICALNLDYIKRAHTRMISYWNEFYRWDCYRYENYIGKKLYRDCFGYSKTGQKSIKFE